MAKQLFEGDQIYYLDHHQETGIDWNDPSRIAMAREEKDNDDLVDLDGVLGIPRDAVKRILQFVVPHSGLERKKWKVAGIRLAILSHICSLDDVGGSTLTALAAELGCTRSLASLYSTKMIDELGFSKSRVGRKASTREANRQAALASHRARNHRMSEDVKPSLD